MSPLARENCTRRQCIQHPALMASMVMIARGIITAGNWSEKQWFLAVFISPAQEFRALRNFGRGEACSNASTMPRLRGKPRRGSAWQRAESRRQRHRKFERALVLASARRKEQQRTPPMEIIEEISLEEAMNSRPTWVPEQESTLPPGDTLRGLLTESLEDFFPPCIVEEEIPPDSTKGTEEHGHGVAEDNIAGKKEPPPIAINAAQDPETKAPDGGGGTEQPAPSEISHLPLIFELRSLMDDQVFRLARMDQRLDMLFAAHSKNLPPRQCPTCAQLYSLPAGW
jgi:hypothetical protein